MMVQRVANITKKQILMSMLLRSKPNTYNSNFFCLKHDSYQMNNLWMPCIIKVAINESRINICQRNRRHTEHIKHVSRHNNRSTNVASYYINMWSFNSGLTENAADRFFNSGLAENGADRLFNSGLTENGADRLYNSGLTENGANRLYSSGLTENGVVRLYNSGLTENSADRLYNSGLIENGAYRLYNSGLTEKWC